MPIIENVTALELEQYKALKAEQVTRMDIRDRFPYVTFLS